MSISKFNIQYSCKGIAIDGDRIDRHFRVENPKLNEQVAEFNYCFSLYIKISKCDLFVWMSHNQSRIVSGESASKRLKNRVKRGNYVA